eukprot:UN28306
MNKIAGQESRLWHLVRGNTHVPKRNSQKFFIKIDKLPVNELMNGNTETLGMIIGIVPFNREDPSGIWQTIIGKNY